MDIKDLADLYREERAQTERTVKRFAQQGQMNRRLNTVFLVTVSGVLGVLIVLLVNG